MEITYKVAGKTYYSRDIDESITEYEEESVVISDAEVRAELAKILIDNQNVKLTPKERELCEGLLDKIIRYEDLQGVLEDYYRDELKEIFVEREEYAR